MSNFTYARCLIGTLLALSQGVAASGAMAADAWRISATTDKLSGTSMPQADALVTADDGHKFSLNMSLDSFGSDIVVVMTITGLEDNLKFKPVDALNGRKYVFQVGVRIDGNAVHYAGSAIEYNNVEKIKFVPDDGGASGGMFEALSGAAGSIKELAAGSVLKLEPTLSDGEQPLITVAISPTLKRFLGILPGGAQP